MDQGLEQFQWSRRKVALLEQSNARRGAYTQPGYQWNFRAAVSCPPSTIIHVRGGRVWGDPDSNWDGTSWYVPSASYDISDQDVIGYYYTFTGQAYWYKPLTILIRWSGKAGDALPTPLYVDTSAAQPTAELAEEAAYPDISTGHFDPDLFDGIPLAIFILRNNGNTTDRNQFMPIDRVNRGRSYLWRNVKLRYMW
jgi:hypothetical protein